VPRETKQWSQHAAFFHEGDADGLVPRYVSAEIEFNAMDRYGRYLSDLVHKRQHGHTLKDASCGWEINTAPARGALYATHLLATCDMLEAARARLDKRCGLHVHVNVGGVETAGTRGRTNTRDGEPATFLQLLTVALLWARVEKAILGMVSDSRLDNNYCQPLGDHFVNLVARRARETYDVDVAQGDAVGACYAVAQHFTEADARWVIDYGLYGVTGLAADDCRLQKNPAHDNAFWKNTARTGALNLHSAFYHGTVEVRVHQGSLNYDKILNWTALCGLLVHYALTHTAEDVARLRGTPAEIIDRAINNPAVTAWRKTRFAYWYEKRSAKRHGGAASTGARMGARVRRAEPAVRVAAPPVVPEASEQ
jgi:hypothetical protein